MTASLTPEPAEAIGQPMRRRLSFGFGPRFLVALALGLVWLVPAWWSPRLALLLLIWNALVLLAWAWDLKNLPRPAQLRARRVWSGPLILARAAGVTLEIFQNGGPALRVFALDELAPPLYASVPRFALDLPSSGWGRHAYETIPRRRGDTPVGALFLRYRTFFGLAERWAMLPLQQTVRVLPDLVEAGNQALFLIRSRQMDLQQRRRRQPGLGREFESLREYRTGDEMREICWSATARRRQLVTRTFEAERSQTIWVVLDCGRLLRAEIARPGHSFRLTKLDYAVNAALALAQVGVLSGDRVAALAYGRNIQRVIAAARGPEQIRAWVDVLAQVRAEAPEADHALAARALLHQQTQRALVVWITDFAETPALPDVVEYAGSLAKKHLVLFAAISQPDLAAVAHRRPENEYDLFRGAAALALVQRREFLLRSLRQRGVLALELAPDRLTAALVNEYLSIKERGAL